VNGPIFLSYRKLESEFALKLATHLKNLGVQVWVDRIDGIATGDDWRDAIEEAIARCAALIAVVSPAYVGSRYCRRELARADDLKRPVLPVLLEAVVPTDWPLEIQREQYEDFTGWRDDAVCRARVDALVHRLRAAAGGQIGDPPDAETRYLISLIAAMEAKRGVMQYIELAAVAEATAERRPDPPPEDEWGFVWLLPGAKASPESPRPPAAAGPKERLAGIAEAGERFQRFAIVGEPDEMGRGDRGPLRPRRES
jgi:hypothetical protein